MRVSSGPSDALITLFLVPFPGEGFWQGPGHTQPLVAARPGRHFPELSTFLPSLAAESGQGAFWREWGRTLALWDPASLCLVPVPSGVGPKLSVRGGVQVPRGAGGLVQGARLTTEVKAWWPCLARQWDRSC